MQQGFLVLSILVVVVVVGKKPGNRNRWRWSVGRLRSQKLQQVEFPCFHVGEFIG